MGSLSDPEVTNSDRIRDKEKVLYLDPAKELFLLALRAKKPARANTDYVAKLYTFYGTMVSASFISLWFNTRFDHKGSFRKQNLVPLDKFRQENVIRFVKFKLSANYCMITHNFVSWRRSILLILIQSQKNKDDAHSPDVQILFL
jgi:hypothetical protein